jgi:hypothetical protein
MGLKWEGDLDQVVRVDASGAQDNRHNAGAQGSLIFARQWRAV